MTGTCAPTSCAVDADCIGGAFCWLGACASVTAIAVGYEHACALTSGGAVQCWGYNGQGQLGNGSTTDSHVPVAVTGLSSGVVAISAGTEHTCALKATGGLVCWGYNSTGQLGDNATVDSHVPVAVVGLSFSVAAVAAGDGHTCALTTAGAAVCWGYNSTGQLGNNTTTQSLLPVTVSGLSSGVAAVGVGWEHSCAVTTSGALECWGYNNNGQVGDGSFVTRLTPRPVVGLSSGVAAVTGGFYHTCALTTGGGVQCWGYDLDGEGSATARRRAASPPSRSRGCRPASRRSARGSSTRARSRRAAP